MKNIKFEFSHAVWIIFSLVTLGAALPLYAWFYFVARMQHATEVLEYIGKK